MYAPVNSRYKIYIIDEVHMLSTTAFNALLKTLEEPPKNVIFILATTDVQKVLDTIKSRCQRFDFKRITTEDIVKHLRYISDKENINITDDALYTIAKNSAGGMRDSIALLDQLSLLSGESAISTEDINNLLGRLSFDTLHSLASNIISSKPQEAIEGLEKIYNSGNEPVQILTNLMDYLKNLLIVKNCKPEIVFELTQLNEGQIKELQTLAKNIETHQILFLIDKTADYIKDVKATNNPRLWLEVSIIDLANLTENTTLIELQNRLSRLEGGMPVQNSTPVYKPQVVPPTVMAKPIQKETKSESEIIQQKEIHKSEPEPEKVQTSQQESEKSSDDFAPMPKSKSIPADDIGVLWGQLLENITSPPTRALLKQWANPVKISPEETVLTMKNEIFLGQIQSGSKKEALVHAVDTLFSQNNSNVIIRLPQPDDVQVKPSPRQLTPAQKPHIPTPAPQEEISEEELEVIKEEEKPTVSEERKLQKTGHSDMVNMVVDLFDGKIID